MGELTPEAAALLRAGRGAFRPETSDRERVLRSLGAVLGEAAVGGAPQATPSHFAPVGRFAWGWGKVLGGFSVLGVGAGAIVAVHFWTGAPARPATSAVAPAAIPVVTVASAAAPAPAETEPAVNLAHTELSASAQRTDLSAARPRVRAAARPASDSLAEEVRLLSRAEHQLNEGAGDGALETLAEHERRFPKGALSEQRMAARVEALCTLGRYSDAHADLAKLARLYPRSPHLDGARRFCGNDFTSP